MEKVKDFKKLREEFEGLGPKLNGIESQIQQLDDKYGPLEDEYLRYQILGDSRAAGLKKKLDKIKEQKADLKETLETGRKKLRIMSGVLAEKRQAAVNELNAKYVKKFETKVKQFVKKLEEAEAMEKELSDIREEGRKAMTDIDASADAVKIPAWPVVLMPGVKNSQVPAVRDFIKFIEGNSKIKFKS